MRRKPPTHKEQPKPPSASGTPVAPLPQLDGAWRALAQILADIATSTVRRKEQSHAHLA